MVNPGSKLMSVLAAVSLLGAQLPPLAMAAPPGNLSITTSAQCIVRAGGHDGYRIDWEFRWFYPDIGQLGSNVTVGGEYKLELHNPWTEEYETIFALPYGFGIPLNSQEVRADRTSPRQPHYSFDRIRMTTSWLIEDNGASGTEVNEIACEQQPPPEGKELLTQTPPPPPEAQPGAVDEAFIHTFDSSPFPGLKIDTWLLCYHRNNGRRQDMHYGMNISNEGVPGGEGVVVGGTMKFYSRTLEGEYTLVHEVPFAPWLTNRETVTIDDYQPGRGVAATRLEIEYKASLGTKIDQNSKALRIVRTAGCTLE